MRFEIGQSAADISVLLKTLRGTHPPVRGTVLGSAAVAAVVLAVTPWIVRQTIESTTLEDRVFGVAVVAFMLPFAAALVVDSLTRYEINDEGVTRRSHVPLLSWTIHRADIHQIALELNQGWALSITTRESKRRTLPLDGSLRQALARLYPEIGPYQPTAADIRRWKWLGAALVAVVAAVAVMFWWLGRQGLVSW